MIPTNFLVEYNVVTHVVHPDILGALLVRADMHFGSVRQQTLPRSTLTSRLGKTKGEAVGV